MKQIYKVLYMGVPLWVGLAPLAFFALFHDAKKSSNNGLIPHAPSLTKKYFPEKKREGLKRKAFLEGNCRKKPPESHQISNSLLMNSSFSLARTILYLPFLNSFKFTFTAYSFVPGLTHCPVITPTFFPSESVTKK